MTINKPSFAAASAATPAKIVIRMLDQRPAVLSRLAQNVTPNEIAGFFDTDFQVVELFMSSPDGSYWLRIGS